LKPPEENGTIFWGALYSSSGFVRQGILGTPGPPDPKQLREAFAKYPKHFCKALDKSLAKRLHCNHQTTWNIWTWKDKGWSKHVDTPKWQAFRRK